VSCERESPEDFSNGRFQLERIPMEDELLGEFGEIKKE
jgi:hypothetical protein